MSKPRTLVIGLDGATFDLIKPWAETGYLPTLKRLMSEGTHGTMNAFPNMNSASAWSSIVTGCNQGKHGIFDFGENAMDRIERWHPTTGRDRQRDPFWRYLSAAGQCVGVVNVPVSYPADPVNGFMISGMDAPGPASRGFTHPPGLLHELRTAGIDYILDVPNLGETRRRDPLHLPSIVRDMIQARTRTLIYLMDRYDWDTLMIVYVSTDRMQHHYWATAPVSDSNPYWTPLRDLYHLLDAQIEALMSRAGDETTTLVLSDHGFGPGSSATRRLNPLLAKLGFLRYHHRKPAFQDHALRNLLIYGRRILPPRLQYKLATLFPQWLIRARRAGGYAGIDWSSTKLSGHPWMGTITINLRGRQPQGCVPVEEYDSVRAKVREVLEQLTNPETGKKSVKKVWYREELYTGPYTERASDLNIEWDEQALSKEVFLAGDGKQIILEKKNSIEPWHGRHFSEGIFIAHGPHIRRGTRIPDIRQYDIAPTILYQQGLAVPNDCDGRVLEEIYEPKYVQQRPVEHAEAAPLNVPTTVSELNEQETAQIEKRLRDLGYIE